MRLRPADEGDIARLHEWRNDPETRAQSHGTDPISYEDHARWCRASFVNPGRRLMIAEDEAGEAVGSVRADRTGDGWLLSWTVAPAARGRGVGRRMVAMLAAELDGVVRAEVKVGNPASQRIAEGAGLAFEREAEGVTYWRRTP